MSWQLVFFPSSCSCILFVQLVILLPHMESYLLFSSFTTSLWWSSSSNTFCLKHFYLRLTINTVCFKISTCFFNLQFDWMDLLFLGLNIPLKFSLESRTSSLTKKILELTLGVQFLRSKLLYHFVFYQFFRSSFNVIITYYDWFSEQIWNSSLAFIAAPKPLHFIFFVNNFLL